MKRYYSMLIVFILSVLMVCPLHCIGGWFGNGKPAKSCTPVKKKPVSKPGLSGGKITSTPKKNSVTTEKTIESAKTRNNRNRGNIAEQASMLELVNTHLITIKDLSSRNITEKLLKAKVVETSIYKSKIPKFMDSQYVVIYSPKDVLKLKDIDLDEDSLKEDNIWFLQIDRNSNLVGKLAKTKTFTIEKKAGREGLDFPEFIRNRVIYISCKPKRYNADSLYEEIKNAEDFRHVHSPNKAIFKVISKDEEIEDDEYSCEKHNIYYVVFDKKIKSLSKDIADGILIIEEGKIVAE